MAEGQITSVNPELAGRFDRFLAQEGAIKSTEDPQETAAATTAEEPEVAEEPAPSPEGEVSEPEETPEAEASDESEETAAPAAEESDDDGVETISDLAKAFEVEEGEFLDHLQVPSRDGEGTVSLSEVLNAYTSQPADTEEARLHLESVKTDLRKEHDGKLEELQRITAAMIAQINSDPEVDWNELRDTDPAAYLKERESRDARRADVERSLKEMDSEMARREQEAEQNHNEWRQEQVSTLYRLRPDWKEPENGREAMKDVQEYLNKTGYPQDQIDSLEDAKSILTVWRAAQWQKLQDKRPEVKKRLRLLPRTLRSSARADAVATSEAQSEANKQGQLRERLAETGSVEDAAAAMRGLI